MAVETYPDVFAANPYKSPKTSILPQPQTRSLRDYRHSRFASTITTTTTITTPPNTIRRTARFASAQPQGIFSSHRTSSINNCNSCRSADPAPSTSIDSNTASKSDKFIYKPLPSAPRKRGREDEANWQKIKKGSYLFRITRRNITY
jgi:hypothetical protein